MVTVTEHYDTYPYPERDPEEERKRLITGSPSRPAEIDHYLYGGERDWSQPMRILVAGGGTGDGLIQIAQLMAWAKVPHEILYIDLSARAREIAEARATVRGLGSIRFVTGSLLDAPKYGPFDYVDCCGVLHHLPDPDAGFAALRKAVTPGGGMGFMVYAPHGRFGVYPLQEAFATLFAGVDPKTRLKEARAIVGGLPAGHPFAANPVLSDHKASDAGFYDLLLHGQDRAYDVPDLLTVLRKTGWRLQSFTVPALYDLGRITNRTGGLDAETRMAVAEKLLGTMRKHLGYLVPADEERPLPKPGRASLVPRMTLADPRKLAAIVAQGKAVPVTMPETKGKIALPKEAAPLIAAIDGKRSLAEIGAAAGVDPMRFGALWPKVSRGFGDWGALVYSGFPGRS